MDRFLPAYRTVDGTRSYERVRAIRALTDVEVVGALALASRTGDAYLANVLATEAMNRNARRGALLGALATGAATAGVGACAMLLSLGIRAPASVAARAPVAAALLVLLGLLVGAWAYLRLRTHA